MEGAAVTWPFGDLRVFGYGRILVDPPWRFLNYSAKGEAKNPIAHYDCMTLDELKALPVNHLAAPDCAMAMWAVAPMIPEALELLDAWGFQFKSMAAWAKQSSTGQKWAFGTGYIFRSAAEFIIVGTRGAPRVRSRSVRNLIVAPVREHSRKPDDLHAMMEELYDGPGCELFGREQREGWDVWGNQVDKFEAPLTAQHSSHPA